jgi:16S rRNA C1402 (ribose-2'-O) methylase RsmI
VTSEGVGAEGPVTETSASGTPPQAFAFSGFRAETVHKPGSEMKTTFVDT